MVIAIDFDGTCLTHSFPEIGVDIGAVPVLKKLVECGHELILWTMRCDNSSEMTLSCGYKILGGDFLTDAVNWFVINDIELYGIQRNPTQDEWTTSPKVHANLLIDDSALGCPLKFDATLSDRPFVDWQAIAAMLKQRKIIN